MSLANFKRMRAKGLTGIDTTETCFAAACDIITPEAHVSEYTYEQYQGVMKHWNNVAKMNASKRNSILAELYSLIASDLGGFTLDEWAFMYAHTARDLARVLRQLRDDDKRVVIDTVQRTGEVHSIGLQPHDDDRYQLAGYALPKPLANRPVTPEEIHPFLYESGFNTTPQYPFIGANVVGLPRPAPRYYNRPVFLSGPGTGIRVGRARRAPAYGKQS